MEPGPDVQDVYENIGTDHEFLDEDNINAISENTPQFHSVSKTPNMFDLLKDPEEPNEIAKALDMMTDSPDIEQFDAACTSFGGIMIENLSDNSVTRQNIVCDPGCSVPMYEANIPDNYSPAAEAAPLAESKDLTFECTALIAVVLD